MENWLNYKFKYGGNIKTTGGNGGGLGNELPKIIIKPIKFYMLENILFFFLWGKQIKWGR